MNMPTRAAVRTFQNRAALSGDYSLTPNQAAAMLDYIESHQAFQRKVKQRDATDVCDMCLFTLWALALLLCAAGLFF